MVFFRLAMPLLLGTGVLIAKPQVLRLRNMVDAPATQSASEQYKVRLSLKIVPYESTSNTEPNAQQVDSLNQAKALKRILRCDLENSDHFYIGRYHIVTRPRGWNKQTQTVQIDIHIAERFGGDGQVEEDLGSVLVTGTLQGEQSPYTLQGYRKIKLLDKQLQPKILVEAGSGASVVAHR